MAHTYGVHMSGNIVEFKMHCQSQVKEHFINEWHDGLSARERPLLRTYRLFKSSFGPESYLFNVKDQRYRTAITKLRASSHILEIERGRYSKPIVPSHLRMCKKCNISLCNPRDHCTHSLFQDCCTVKLVTSNHPTYLHRGTTLRWGIVLYALVRKTMHGVIVGKGVRTRRLSDRYCTCVWMSEMFWCDQ